MWKCSVFILCALGMVAKCDEDWRYVNITQGPLRGRIDPKGGVYNFYNIPYASAPTGTNRYKAPVAPPVWMSMFDAEDRGIVCPQPIRILPLFTKVQEDCLVANVFVPVTEETNLPVLVYIHGGAYQNFYGNIDQFKDFVRTKKVIVVTFNYRLGLHGFLCLGTEGAPGNAGLKDQVALLRWVNANIASFGGNPNDVTLAGCSAGFGSVDVLTLSSITTGLFKKAIMESGVSIGGVGLQIDPIQNAKNYAKLLNFDDFDDLNSLEEFYKSATFEQIISRHDATVDTVAVVFGPCVERDIGQERVIKDTAMNVINQGNYTKVPLLYGFSNMDGLVRLSFFQDFKDRMNEKFSDFLPNELYFENQDIKEEVAQKVKEFYFGNEPLSDNSIVSYGEFYTDVLFGYPMLRSLSARVASLGDTIYLYEYSFVDKNTPRIPNTDVRGANHCDQLGAVVDQDTTNISEEYRQMIEIVREYWLNFILTDSPSADGSSLPPWSPANAQRSPYMSLGPVIDAIELKKDILEERAAFWDSIYEKHSRDRVRRVTTTGGAASIVISNAIVAALSISFYFAL